MSRGRTYDLAALAGAISVLVGLWWIWPPLALIVGGVGVMLAAMMGARAEARRSEDDRALRRRSEAGGDEAEVP